MRVLFIGGTKFIGAHAARAMHEQGADVTVFHRGQNENPLVASVRHIHDATAEFPVLQFPREIVSTDWDVVIHMVAMGEADSRAAVSALAGRVGRIVLISSGDVYRAYGRLIGIEPGPPDPVPLTEDAPLRTHLYPYSGKEPKQGHFHDYEKQLAERAVMEATCGWTVLRLPKVYGPEENADLATVYGFAAVPGWRWTHGHVDNVANAIALAATHPAAGRRIFNVGEATTPTMGERLAILPHSKLSEAATPAMNFDQHMACDTSRIRLELEYRDVVAEDEAMRALAAASTNVRRN